MVNDKARLVGINHVALEVGSIDEALSFYGQLFELSLRGRSGKMAFIDIGDQFINLSESRTRGPDKERHFGLVVDDKEKVRRRLKQAGVETPAGTRGRVQGSVGKPGSNRGVREYPVHQAQGGARRYGLYGPSQIARSDRGTLQERNRD